MLKIREVPGVTEGVNGEAHFTALVVDNSLDFTPVVLELLTRLRLEAYGLFGRTQDAFGMHILTRRGTAAVITLLFYLLINDLSVPDMLAQSQINIVHERTKFFHGFTPSGVNGFSVRCRRTVRSEHPMWWSMSIMCAP